MQLFICAFAVNSKKKFENFSVTSVSRFNADATLIIRAAFAHPQLSAAVTVAVALNQRLYANFVQLISVKKLDFYFFCYFLIIFHLYSNHFVAFSVVETKHKKKENRITKHSNPICCFEQTPQCVATHATATRDMPCGKCTSVVALSKYIYK